MATNKTVFFNRYIISRFRNFNVSTIFPSDNFKEGSHSFISSSFVTIFIGVLFILANLEKEFRLNLKQTFLFLL